MNGLGLNKAIRLARKVAKRSQTTQYVVYCPEDAYYDPEGRKYYNATCEELSGPYLDSEVVATVEPDGTVSR